MSGALVTDVELADQFGIDVARLHRLRREKKWPCVKFSRTDFRFTPEQVEQIVAMQTVKSGESTLAAGLTKRGRGAA